MAAFVFHPNADGSISHITKDGQAITGQVTLSHPNEIICTYYQSAFLALAAHDAAENTLEKMRVGLQGFLASLFGLEAFLNVFFLVAAREHGNAQLETAIQKNNLQVSSKLKNWPHQLYGIYIQNQKEVCKRVASLFALRNELVHPRMDWSTLWTNGILIDGLVENPVRTLANISFCQQAFEVALLAVLRTGMAAGSGNPSRFCTHWTGTHASESELSTRLGL